jgi:hypothetical protein
MATEKYEKMEQENANYKIISGIFKFIAMNLIFWISIYALNTLYCENKAYCNHAWKSVKTIFINDGH